MSASAESNQQTTSTIEVILPCRFGLHVRNASLFLRFLEQFESDIRLRHRDVEVNGRSVLGLLTLGVAWRSKITVIAEGSDAVQAALEIKAYLSDSVNCADDS